MGTRSSPTDLWDVVRVIQRRLGTLETGSGMDWVVPTLQNGWLSYTATDPTYVGPRYRRLSSGQVEMQGLVRAGTMNTAIFTLPIGYRPSLRLAFPTISNDAIARLDVAANGQVIPVTGANVYVSVNCTFTPTAP